MCRVRIMRCPPPLLSEIFLLFLFVCTSRPAPLTWVTIISNEPVIQNDVVINCDLLKVQVCCHWYQCMLKDMREVTVMVTISWPGNPWPPSPPQQKQNWHQVETSFLFEYLFNLFANLVIIIHTCNVCCFLCSSAQWRTQITMQGWFHFWTTLYTVHMDRQTLLLQFLQRWCKHTLLGPVAQLNCKVCID